jgi:hypothetical protein
VLWKLVFENFFTFVLSQALPLYMLAVQGYLERLTVGILKSLQLYQLIPLGLMGLIILEGPRVCRLFGSHVITTVIESEVAVQDTDMALVDECSLVLKRFDLSNHADG